MIQNRMRSMGRALNDMHKVLNQKKGDRVLVVFAPLEDISYFTDHSEGIGVPCLVNRSPSVSSEWRDLSDVLKHVQDPRNNMNAVFWYMPMTGEYVETMRQIDENEEMAYMIIGPIHEEE